MKSRWMLTLLALLGATIPALAQQGPTGGTVVQGTATITNPNGTTTQITQSTDRAVINWNSFSIGAGNQVIFSQPGSSSVALNRVTGVDPSSILGSLTANGQVFLLNPNGIVFGQGSTVNTAGFMASTLSLSDADFMAGRIHLTQDPSQPLSYVVNQGTINSTSYAALVAPLVENSGTINAPGGQVYLLASTEAVLTLNGNNLIGYSIGNVKGGTVIIRPDALSDAVRAVVNTAGLVEAGSVVNNPDGTVSLVGAGGTLVNSGTVNTKGVDGGNIVLNSSLASVLTPTSKLLSDGGTIEFSALQNFQVGGGFDTLSPSGAPGLVLIDPPSANIIAGNGPPPPGTLTEGFLASFGTSVGVIGGQIVFEDIPGYSFWDPSGPYVLVAGITLKFIATAGGGAGIVIPNDITISNPAGSLVLSSVAGVSGDGLGGSGGRINAGNLLLLGTGTFNLNSSPSTVGTFAANVTGSIQFNDGTALTLGSVLDPFTASTTSGVSSGGGNIQIQTQNAPLTVSQPVNAGAGSLTLVANDLPGGSTGNLTVNADLTGSSITVFAGGNLVVNGPVAMNGGPVSLTGTNVTINNLSSDSDVTALVTSGISTGTLIIGGVNTANSWNLITNESPNAFGNNYVWVQGDLISTGGDINITSADTIYIYPTGSSGPLGHVISAGNITLRAAFGDNDGVGFIDQENDGANSIIVANGGFGSLTAIAKNGITLGAGGSTVLEVGTLHARNISDGAGAANGNINVVNTGELTLADLTGSGFAVENQGGAISISAIDRTFTYVNNTPVAIPDLGTGSSSVLVSGLTGTVRNVTTSFYITHTFDSDLQIDLLTPGSTVNLVQNRGGSGDNFGTSLANQTLMTDAAGSLISAGAAPFSGSFRPEQALSTLNGASGGTLNGTWTLRAQDQFALDSGAIQGWTLNIRTSSNLTVNGAVRASSSVNLSGTGAVRINSPVLAQTTVQIQTTGPGDLLTNSSSITSTSDHIWMFADRMDLSGGTINTPYWVWLGPSTPGRTVDLGSVSDSTPNALELSVAELGTISSFFLTLGSGSSGALNISQPLTFTTAQSLELLSGSTISQSAGAPLAVTYLHVQSTGAATLTEPTNNVRFLSAFTGGTLTYVDADILSIGNSGFFNGIEANGNDVSVTTINGDIGLDALTHAAGATVSITAGGAHWIGQFQGTTSRINALNAVLVAGAGIGNVGLGNGAIRLDVTNLQAINTGNGDIQITDLAGGLTLTNVSGVSPYAVVDFGSGNINIRANSPLTVNAPVYAISGNITLAAGESGGPGDNLTINAEVMAFTAGDSLFLSAGDNIILNMALIGGLNGGKLYAPNRIEMRAAFADAGDGGAISQTSGVVQTFEVLATAESGISLGQAGSTFLASRLQAENAGPVATGSINIADISSVEIVNYSNPSAAGLINTATVGGQINVSSTGFMTISSPVFAVNSINLSGAGGIFDNACIMSINGPILLNGTAYPVPGGDPSVALGPNSCFEILGPADYLVIACDPNNPNPTVTLSSNVSVAGRIVILTDGNIVVNSGVTLSSGTGIVMIADWAICGSDGIGSITTSGSGLLRSNEFSLSAASGISVNTQSLNPVLPSLFQVRNARFDGAVNTSTVTINHTGNAVLSSFDLAFDAGSPAFLQNNSGDVNFNVTGNLTIANDVTVADDVLVRGFSFWSVSGNGAVLRNSGTMRSLTSALELFTFGDNTQVVNDGAVIASNYIWINAIGNNNLITNNGSLTSTNQDVGMDTSGANGLVTNNGSIVSHGARITSDRINLAANSSITEHDGDFVNLLPYTAGRLIDLGSAVDTTPNTLELSNAELNTIVDGFGTFGYRLNIGGFTIFGGSSTAGAINISAPINVVGTGAVGALILDTASTITQTAPLALPNHLVLYSGNRTTHNGGDVTLTNPGNNALQITADVGGNLNYVDADLISIAQFGGTGIVSHGHNVTVTTVNGPIQFGLGAPYFFGGGTINAGTGTVRLTAQGATGAIDRVNSGVWDIIANQAILVADAGIGNTNFLATQINELQAVNNGVTPGTPIRLYDVLAGGLTVRAIDPTVSTFGILNNDAGFGWIDVWEYNGPITISSPVQSATGYIRFFAPESGAANNDIHVRADVRALANSVYLWAGDRVLIGEGGTNPLVTAAVFMDLLPAYGDSDNLSELTQFSGTIVSPIVRAQSENGISLGAIGSSVFQTNQLSLINMGLQSGSGTDIGNPTGNVVVHNTGGNLDLYEGFGAGMGLVNTATAVGQGNLQITTDGTLTVDVPVFATRQVDLQGSSIIVNQRIASVTGPILLNGTSYPTGVNGTVTDNTNGAFLVYAAGAPASSVIIIWADNNGGTDQNYVYSGGNVNTAGSVIIISEGSITIPAGTTLRAAGGIVLYSDWDFAHQNGVGSINASGASLQSGQIFLGAASGITASTRSLTLNGTTLLQIVNTTSGNVVVDHQGNAIIADMDTVLNSPAQGLSNAGGGTLDFSATGNITLNAGVQNLGGGLTSLTAGGSIFDDGLQTTFIRSDGPLFLTAANGSIGAGDLNGTSTTGYVDVELGGTATLTLNVAGNAFIQEVGAGTALNSSQLLVFTSTGAGHVLGLSSLTGDVNFDVSFGAGLNDLVISGNDITIGGAAIVSASDRITFITSAGGDLTGAAGSLVRTRQLVLNAAGDITLPSTEVRELQVLNGGDVTITNVGDIVLTSIVPGFAVNAGGTFTLTAMSSITVAAPVVAGAVTLSADDNVSVLSSGRVEATGGDIILEAVNGSIVVNANTSVIEALLATGAITLTAGTNISIVDSASIPFGTVNAAGGDLKLRAQGNINLNGVFAGASIRSEAFGNSVLQGSYTATAGNLNLFAAGTFASDADYSAAFGISIEGLHGVGLFGGNGGSIVTTTGPVDIRAELGSVMLQQNVSGSSVSITAQGTVDIESTVTATFDGVTVFTGGNVIVGGVINANGLGAASISITSVAGAIVDGNGAGVPNVSTPSLTASAPGGIELDTTIATLDATSTGGNITIRNTGDLNLNPGVSAPLGTATISTTGFLQGTLTAQTAVLTAPAGITLDTTVGTLTATSTNLGADIFITETDGLALRTLTANDIVSITAGGPITDAGGVAQNIIASSATLIASGGIGTFAAPIKTQVGSMTLFNDTAGDIVVVNTGSLQLNPSINFAGSLSVSVVGGELDLFGDGLTSSVEIGATGNVLLSATDGILMAGVEIESLHGISITSPSFMDVFSSGVQADDGDVRISSGGLLRIDPFFGGTSVLIALDAGSGRGSVILSGTTGVQFTNTVVTGVRDISVTSSGPVSLDNTNLAAGGKVTVSGDGVTIFGDGVPGTFEIVAGGDVSITSASSVSLINLEISSATLVRLTAGSFISQSGVSDIQGPALVASADSGITLPSANTATLQATNTGSGFIDITSQGALTLADIDGLGWAVRNFGGSISVVASGDLTLAGPVNAGSQTVTLTSSNGSLTNGGNAANVIVAGDAFLSAGSIIDVNTSVDVLTATLTGAANYIRIREANGITLDSVNAGSGDVSIVLAAGAILDGDFTTPTITATNLFLSAPGGIGSSGLPLQTLVSQIEADGGTGGVFVSNGDILTVGPLGVSSAGGNIFIHSDDDLTLQGIVNAGSGNVSLDSGGSIFQSGGSVHVVGSSLKIRASGGVDLDTQVGFLDLDNTDVFPVTISNQGNLIVGRATTLGSLEVNVLGDLAVVGTVRGESVNMTASGSLALNGATVTSTDGDVTLSALGGTLTVDGDGNIFTTEIQANFGSINLSSTGNLSIRNAELFADGNITIGSTGSILVAGSMLTADGGRLDLGATGDVVISDSDLVANGTDVSVLAGGSLVLSGTTTVQAAADLILSGTTGVNLSGVAGGAGGAIRIDSTGDVVLNGSTLGAGTDLNVTAGGTLSITGDANALTIDLAASGSMTLIATSNVTITDADLSAGNRTTITSGGAITQTGGSLASDELVLTAVSGITIPHADVLTLQATNTSVGNLLVYNVGSLELLDLTGVGWAVNNAGGGIDIETGGGSNILVSSPVVASGAISLEADGDIQVNASLTAGTRITLAALNGGVNPVFSNALITAPELVVTATGNIDLENLTVARLQASSQFGSVFLVDNIGVTVTDLALLGFGIQANNNVFLQTLSGDVTLAAPVNSFTVTIISAGAIIDGNGPAVNINAFAADLEASGGIGTFADPLETSVVFLTVNNDTLGDVVIVNVGNLQLDSSTNAAGSLSVTAIGSLTLTDADVVALNGNLSLIAQGPLLLDNSSALAFDAGSGLGNVTLSGTTVTVQNSQVFGDRNVTITSGGDLLLADSDLGTAATMRLTSGGSILQSGTGSILAGNLIAEAVTGITLPSIDVDTVTATLTGAGDIAITDIAGGLAVTSATAPGGSISITAVGGDLLLGFVSASNSATLIAQGGSILDNNDVGGVETLNVLTGGNATLQATGVVGVINNCIEVQIGGTLFVGAGGSINGVSIVICGTTSSGDFTPIGPPSGSATFNGFDSLGGQFNAGASFFELLDPRRRFNIYYQYPLVNWEIFIPVPIDDEREKKRKP
jgi:filamentous hemagglutinin family protein